jgi:hypothetical protein
MAMKTGFLIALMLLTSSQVGAVTTTSFVNTSGDGLWGTATNWSLGEVPFSTNNAVINNGLTATIAANAPSVDMVTVGNNAISNTTLNIGANLTANTFLVASVSNSIGHVKQTGGTVTISNSFTIASVNAGADTGTYTISGGSLVFSNNTLSVGTSGAGLFAIVGSSLSRVSGGSLALGGHGTLLFELDTLGVTPLTLTGSLTRVSSSQLVVDGTDYEGWDGYFPLILSTNLTGSFTNATLTGFGAREPALVLQADGLWLRVIAPPTLSARLCSLVPDSTVAPDWSNTTFSATRTYDPSGSAWTPTFSEAHVMDARLSQTVIGSGSTNRSWDLRVGRGGQIYSLRTPALGETVPPSYRSDDNSSPWNDEVWQGIAVNTSLNNPPGSNYFIHQSGVYLVDPALTKPFYSPQVAAVLNPAERSFTTINWGQHAAVKIYTDASTNNDFKSYLLYFTRCRDLGQGVIEVSLGLYNYGPDILNFFNMPWGGVRRTSTEYAFLSKTNGTGWSSPLMEGFGPTTNFDLTGGWVAFSASSNGATPALGQVFGFDNAPLLTNQPSDSFLRWGYTADPPASPTETNWRNYFVLNSIRRYNLTQGRGIWGRYYFVLGDNVADLASRIAARGLATNAILSAFNYTEASTPLVAYSFTGSGADFRITENSNSPQFFLYAYPVGDSFPIYEIIEKNRPRYLTWNPYTTGVIKTYDGTIEGIRLLGFALRSTAVNSAGTSYAYTPLAAVMSDAATNYIASGENLSARTATPIETWRIEYFGVTDNVGTGANTANPDGDSANNLVEYALGGNPTNAVSVGYDATAQIIYASGTNWFNYVYARRRDAAASGLSYTVEATTNLVFAGWSTNGIAEIGAGIIDSRFEAVTNRIETGDTGFVRLRIGGGN